MLSFVNLSDPSCSSTKVTADEKDPADQLAPQKADPVLSFDHESQTPNFSIRDYAFASRSKNISTSWPFPSQFLQLFLKHGIRDLLPPLETPSSVRLHCTRPLVDVSHTGDIVLLNVEHKTTGIASCLSSEGVFVRCLDEAEEDLCEVGKPVKLIANGDCEIGSSLTNHCDIWKNPTQISEQVVKKCRLVLKSGAISEPSRAEEIASASSTASDPMASKVCPVCKTFSSTSNTTLNAHMDQCLNFLESDTHWAEDKTSKFKVKPRKKRLMEDIYAAAPYCTLEDLDRRNGTCWASDLSLVAAPINELSMVAYKEHNLSQVDTRDHKSEGAVYVDSNGIKLRILSKFSDTLQVMPREDIRPSNYDECISMGSQISLIEKKKHLAAKYSKKMKFKLKNRKLSSLKLFKDEIQATAEVAHEETHIREQGTQVELSGEQEPISNCESAILRRWPCSKRSDLPKKVISKHFHRSLEHPKPLSGSPISENKKTAPAKIVFFSRSQPESIAVHSTSIAVQSNANQKKSSQILSPEGTSTNAELPRLSAAFGSSLKSASEDLCMVKFDKSPDTNKRSTGSFLLSLKTKRLSNLIETNSITKKLRKHRSLPGTTMRKSDVFSDSNSGPKKSAEASAVRFPGKMVADQSLYPGSSQHQDANSRSSEMQIETSVLATISSIKKPDVTSILLPETVYAEYQGLPMDAMTIKTMSEPVGQIAHGKLEKQKVVDVLECGGAESQAESISPQGSSACLTSHVHRENSSRASAPLVPNVENKLAISRKPSVSPSLTTSPISPFSPTDCHTTTSDTEHLPSIILHFPQQVVNEGTQEIDVESNHQVPFDSIASQHQQVLDFQPCCCSRQRIKPWSVPTLPNLYINPGTPVMESPTASILTRAGSDFGSLSPTCGTPTQSRTTSSIRLMGKNLIVMNTEEYVDQLPKIHSETTDNNSNSQSLALPFGFASHAGIPNGQSFSHAAVHTTPAPEMSYMAMRRGSFSAQTRKINKAYVTNDVTLLDDSPDDDIGSRRSLPQAPVLRPMLPNPIFPYFARGNNGLRPSYLMDGGVSWELTAPLVFQSSPTPHLSPPFYHMQSLR